MAIVGEEIHYIDGETALTGTLYRDDEQGARPGLLLIHGAGGLDEHANGQAQRYTKAGFTVFACDVFGPGVAGNRERTIALLTNLRDDPDLLAQRVAAGLAVLAEHAAASGTPGVVGFCFGGLAALELARTGAPVAAVVTMHGPLATKRPAVDSVTAKILVCHGSADPHVPMTDVGTFAEEMNTAGADWQLIMYGGALHGFTHTHAVPGGIPGVEYHQAADERSFAAACAFLAGV